MLLRGRTAVATGSTSGIGLGIADGLAAAGADVILNGFGERDEIERLRADLAARHGRRVLYSAADMSRTEDIEQLIGLADREFGRLDILVNNAGIQHVAPIEEFPIEKWDLILAINLSAAFKTIRFALPLMKRNNCGRIINIASAHAHVASPFKSAYVSAKHGLLGLTKTVALEVAEKGITCNAVCPGYVLTPLVRKQIPDTAKARGISEEAVIRDVLLGAQPTKQFVTTEQVAGTTVFLCSDAAASITGTSISIDGGWTAH
jgi:3-hydroxybutyrate dehydrogenase